MNCLPNQITSEQIMLGKSCFMKPGLCIALKSVVALEDLLASILHTGNLAKILKDQDWDDST